MHFLILLSFLVNFNWRQIMTNLLWISLFMYVFLDFCSGTDQLLEVLDKKICVSLVFLEHHIAIRFFNWF